MKPAALLIAFLIVPIPAVPDVIPSGMHGVRFSMTVDPGAFAANLCRRYKVVAGDTLEGIARRECGDAVCVEEIRLLNFPEELKKLEAGMTIAIPPRAPTSDSRAASRPENASGAPWVFFHRIGTVFAPILANEVLAQHSLAGPTCVVAVERSKLGWLLRGEWKNLDETQGAAVSDPLPYTRVVKQSDPTWRIEATAHLKGVKDGRVLIDVSEKRFDKSDKLLSESGRGVKRGGLSPMVLLFAAAALIVIGQLGAKRRRSDSRSA